MKMLRTIGVAAAAVLAVTAGQAEAREQIRIVGSSTVYPFASYVVEEFGATTKYPTPVIESTGSGGGLKLFCAGSGADTPDITNASRRIKVSELKRCQDNGVKSITEAVIGSDGIVLANSVDAPQFKLTREQITLAVAAQVPENGELVKNPHKHWDDIDASLPHEEILIYGPPTTSGTRDAFEELVMEAASEEMEGYGGGYTKIRQDGVYVPAGENDNLIVQKLIQNKNALGIFGYGFLEENTDRIQGSRIDGVAPKPDTIASGEYPVSRSLFFYVKNAHAGEVPGLYDYVNLFLSEKMVGDLGYLKRLGLIPLPKERREAIRQRAGEHEALELADLK
ncbi:PstS family phosphate ABC transporter substrate-binding protein [Thiohalorhabdus methylotrophus]|uniref:PstS family phosphate ABC transporter substrate-binding protein n=1 Tax=Thiohalorhabdus methylotrophus TaxID=3242694 RepID=A0ABV4TR30_9GAMM